MHISRIVLTPTLLILLALIVITNAFPTHPKTEALDRLVHESITTKSFTEGSTSVVGDMEKTAVANAGPTTYSFNVDGSMTAEHTAIEDKIREIALEPASPSMSKSWNATTPSNMTISSNTTMSSNTTEVDPLANYLDRSVIVLQFWSSTDEYGFPSPSSRQLMTPAQSRMITNLLALRYELPLSDRNLASGIIVLLEQKILHEAAESAEATEQVDKAQVIVEAAIEDVFKVYGFDPISGEAVNVWGDDGDGSWERTQIFVREEKRDDAQPQDEQEPASTHILDSRSPKKSKNKNEPPTCPNGSPIPYGGIADCPPLTKWQLAQQQDRELNRHLSRKEKADMRRDHTRIATTTFASVACVVSRVFCPVLTVQGVI
ncbi:hypothetical protein BKA65DRAFT_479237 [Rhexocercosporidium sp. MPI-PUGE-AT-0058]|nr:hypothetical protein BKA65DRAFT_479237 [Rhexocercosporidium sp. MPI-PUGE-AT-0058]